EATATPELIADAMAVNSVAMLTLGTAGSAAGWIPLNYPLLIVQKGGGSSHVMFEAQAQDGGAGTLYRGYYNANASSGEKWTGWLKISTATLPQEYDLLLAEGIGSSAKYSKDQFGRVQLRGWITGATANMVVATLPAGFRPVSDAHFIQAISSASQCGIVRVVVRTDGTIYVELPQDGTLSNGLSLQLSFLAAS
ncbi:hypothetical protein, partial [Pseudoflavonifractor phocaeensis]|uniref:hypothetical protein n=1 Tax=Pseudoflavonifractor phocaeensis TaxID=1870988 RepID=UPI001955FAA6